MRVALVFNQKKEDSTQQSRSDSSADPPSRSGNAPRPFASRARQDSPFPPPADFFAEWDSADTIEAVRSALAEVHEVTLVEADENAFARLRELRPDIVFNIAEGLYGSSREAQMPSIFEMLRIPYTGSDPLTLGLCLDKSRAKEILSYHGIPTPNFTVIAEPADLDNVRPGAGFNTKFPLMVKPLHEGSSKGITNTSLVRTLSELRRIVSRVLADYREPVILEDYLPGREFTVAMLGNVPDVRVLPIVEIKFGSLPEGVNHIYSYEAKWIWDQSDNPLDIFDCPARIPAPLQQEIESACLKAYEVMGCRDWCRIDVRLDAEGRPNIIELNPLPGILPRPEDNSCFPKAARAAGLSYAGLLQTVLAQSAHRYGLAAKSVPQTPQSELVS